MDYYINGVRYELSKNDCMFINSNILHMVKSRNNNSKVFICGIVFLPALFAHTPDSLFYQKYMLPVLQSQIDGFKIDFNTPEGKRIINAILKMNVLNCEDLGYELQCLSLLTQIWIDIIDIIFKHSAAFKSAKIKCRHENDLKQILSYIHHHYAENIAIDDLIKLVNISRSECFRNFKLFTNKKPVKYINEYRLMQAARMLTKSTQNITEICHACGFFSSSYFGKLFKDKYGITPLQYRKEQTS